MARILVADDEESVRELLCTVLGQKGHEVLLADGGQKALELYWRRRPQLTILDLCMPDIMGLEVLEKIRKQDANAPVIILTGYANPEAVEIARSLGVTDFLRKEFSLHELGAAIRQALGLPPKTGKATGHGP